MGLGMSIGIGFGLTAVPSSSSRRQGDDSANTNTVSPAVGGNFLTLGKPGGTFETGSSGAGRIPAHPVGCCLEALLSFFLDITERNGEQLSSAEDDQGTPDVSVWTSFVSSAMINVLMSASAVITGGLAVDSALLDFRKPAASKSAAADRLLPLMEGYLSGEWWRSLLSMML